MLIKFGRCLGFAVAGMALANVAHAEDVPVMTGAAATRLGGEFRSEYIYDNQGLYKHAGYSPSATSGLQVTDVNVLLSGYLNADTEYAFRFNLLNPGAGGPVDFGYGTHWFTKMFGFSVGKERVMQGGWDNMDEGYRTHVQGVYAQNLALVDYSPMVALHAKLAGLVSLQVVNDVVQDPTNVDVAVAHRYNKSEHPAFVIGWLGEFGPIKPLIDLGSYDNSKSHWVDVGVKTVMNGLNATLDFHQDNEAFRVDTPDATANTVNHHKENDVKTSYTVNVSYEVKSIVTPWAYYSNYSNKEASDNAIGAKDIKYNSSMAVPTTTAAGGYAYNWNDNGNTWGAGVDFNTFGKNWNPFIAYVANSGKFLKAGSTSVTETRTDSQLKIGVLGQI